MSNVNQIVDTIVLARFSDGRVREIKASLWLSTANIIDKPLTRVTWDEDFKVKYDEPTKLIDPMSVIQCVCDYFQVTFDQLKAKSRQRGILVPRQITMVLLRRFTTLSHKAIGQLLGNRDHTTCIHSCAAISDQIQTDEAVLKIYNDLNAQCFQTLEMPPLSKKVLGPGLFRSPIARMA